MLKSLPTPEMLRKLLRYEPETGKLFWRKRPIEMFPAGNTSASANCSSWNARFAGKLCFTSNHGAGYCVSSLFNKTYFAHRVIWAMQTGAWPKDQIDHKDHDRSNNKWPNLRDVSHSVNQRNRSRSPTNTSGTTGVSWCKQGKKWRANIRANGRQKHLGLFPCVTAAIFARKRAEIKYLYHPNHGRLTV